MRYYDPKNPIEIGSEDWEAIRWLITALINNLPDELMRDFKEYKTVTLPLPNS